MSTRVPYGRLPLPDAPQEYSREYLNRLVRSVELALEQFENPGALEATTLNLSQVYGYDGTQRNGDVFLDDNGFLKLVQNMVAPGSGRITLTGYTPTIAVA